MRLQVSYEAGWNAEDQDVTVIRSIHAGISGPAETFHAETRDEAERKLFNAGYLVSGEWSEHVTGWYVPLSAMFEE